MFHAYLAIAHAQAESLIAPTRQLQRLAVDHTARLATLQTEALRGYTQIAVEQLRAMLALTAPDDLGDALDRQRNALRHLGERFDKDSQTLAGLGQDFSEQTARLAENVIFLDRLPPR